MSSTETVPAGRFIITGTSGTGKTCLIACLSARGHRCYEETVRRTLADQLASDGPALPSKDPRLFVQELLRQSVRDLTDAETADGTVFFDRGIPDIVVYALRFGVEPAEAQAAAGRHRYSARVFILPPWRDIFVNDEFRRASFDDYCEIHAMTSRAYLEAGYELVEVPKAEVEARADFIECIVRGKV